MLTTTMLKAVYSALFGWFAAQAVPDLPGVSGVVEKAGAWGLVAMLMYFVLGVLSKKLDALSASIDKLSEKVDDHNHNSHR